MATPTMEDLAQIYRDAGLTPPARFVGNNTPVTQQDIANTQNFVGTGGGGGGDSGGERDSGGGGEVTAEQVLAMFDQLGKDPGIHQDLSREDPLARAERIAAEINSGQRTQEEVIRAIETLPSGGGGGGGGSVGGGGKVTPEQVLQWFDQLGKDPGVHADLSTEDPQSRAIRIAQEINSGQRTQTDVFQSIRNLPDDPFAGTPSLDDLQGLIDDVFADITKPIDFRAAAANLFPTFPPALLDVFADAWARFGDPNLALAEVRQNPLYDTIFPGLKRDDGSLRMTESEYLARIDGYKLALSQFNLNPSNFSGRFVEMVEGELTAGQFASRLSSAFDQIITQMPEIREFYSNNFGIGMTDESIFASFLDTDLGDAILNRRISQAQIGGSGAAAGFNIDLAFSERLRQRGLGLAQAQGFFGDAASRLPTLSRLATRFGLDKSFDITEFAGANIFGDPVQQRRIGRLLGASASSFSERLGTVRTEDDLTLSGLSPR